MAQPVQAQHDTQAKQAKKKSFIVAGVGAAIIASAIVIVMNLGGGQSPAPSTDVAETGPQCASVLRQLLVSTNGGSGTVRLREGNYLSAPIKLSATPQTVTFPVARTETVSASEVIVIEGDATNVILKSPLTTWQKTFDSVHGLTAFETRWSPSKSC